MYIRDLTDEEARILSRILKKLKIKDINRHSGDPNALNEILIHIGVAVSHTLKERANYRKAFLYSESLRQLELF